MSEADLEDRSNPRAVEPKLLLVSGRARLVPMIVRSSSRARGRGHDAHVHRGEASVQAHIGQDGPPFI